MPLAFYSRCFNGNSVARKHGSLRQTGHSLPRSYTDHRARRQTSAGRKRSQIRDGSMAWLLARTVSLTDSLV